MKDYIVNLEISMYERPSIPRLCPPLGEELHDVVKMRNLADLVLTLYISCACLGEAETAKEGYLPIIEAFGLAEGGERDACRVNAMKASKLPDRVMPPIQSRVSLVNQLM